MDRDRWDETFWGRSYHTHLSQETTVHLLAELLFPAMAVKAAGGHGLTGQLQIDKMISTLNGSIMITENTSTKYELIASHLHMSAC